MILVHSSKLAALLLPAALGMGACRSVGPMTVSRDRFNYSSALAESWKRQMLLNIVKTRYLDLPVYLDVGQIVSGYTLESSASLGGSLNSGGAPAALGNSIVLGGATRFADSPTITYAPLTGEQFLEAFLAPIDPVRLLSLLQAGYAADFILEMGVDSLNGLRNRPVGLGSKRHADPEFYRAVALLRDIQDDAALGLRIERPKDGEPLAAFFFRSDSVGPEVRARITEAEQLMSLASDQPEFRIVSSPMRGGPGELAIATRSLSQMIAALALEVEVPARHLEQKLTPPVASALPDHAPLLRVHSGPGEPTGAFAAVPYEGQWFWIANDDWRSKRVVILEPPRPRRAS